MEKAAYLLAVFSGMVLAFAGWRAWELRRRRIQGRLGGFVEPFGDFRSASLGRGSVRPLLTEKEATDEYLGTLKRLGEVALFQLTFLLTVLYVFLADHSPGVSLFGLSFAWETWLQISVIGGVALNLYAARNLRYLTKLLRMHPQLRRKFRFYAYHHVWFSNPIRMMSWPHKKPMSIGVLYVFLLNTPLFMLSSPLAIINLPYSGTSFTTAAISALVVLQFGSAVFAASALVRHVNLLWANRLA